MAVVASTSSRTVPSSSWQESKTSEKPEQRADPTGVEDVDSSTATTDAKDKEISDLQMRLELYKNYLGEVARFRQPKSSSTRKPKVIDPKWVRGLEIPVAAHQQRLYDPIVIVFDPISATFASMNEKLALKQDYDPIPLPYYNFPFDIVTIFADSSGGLEGWKLVAESTSHGKKRGMKSAREQIISFPLAALGSTVILKRLFGSIRMLHVLAVKPSSYQDPTPEKKLKEELPKAEKNEKPLDLRADKIAGDNGALRAAVCHGELEEVERQLTKGADLNTTGKENRTVLHQAAKRGQREMVRILLERGADVDPRDDGGRTPLSVAARKGHDEIVRILLRHGASVDLKDKTGRTPLSFAAEEGHYKVVKYLVEKDAKINTEDNNGRTPLSYAASNGHTAVLNLLLFKEAEIDSKSRYGQTPLTWAAGNGHLEAVKALIQTKADVNSQDNFGRTPILFAASEGHTEVVRELLMTGAKTDAFEKDGVKYSPLILAEENNHKKVVKLLQSGLKPMGD